jgi:hypothetical protein
MPNAYFKLNQKTMIRSITKTILLGTAFLFVFTGIYAGENNKGLAAAKSGQNVQQNSQTTSGIFISATSHDSKMANFNAHVFKGKPNKVPPVNDNICSATELIPGGPVVIGDNREATLEAGEPAGSCWSDLGLDSTVWFYFVPATAGIYNVTTDLNVLLNNDTQLAAYLSSNGSCNGTLTEIACNDDVGGGNFLSTMDVVATTPNDTVFIQVDGWLGTSGDFEIQVGAPQPLTGDASVVGVATGGVLNYASIPGEQVIGTSQGFSALAVNSGTSGSIDNVQITADLNSGAVNLTTPTVASVALGADTLLSSSSTFTVANTAYTGSVTVSTTSPDSDPTNDSYAVNLTIGDSVLARENASTAITQLSFSATNYIGNVIEVASQDTLTSISAYFTGAGGVTYPITASLAFLDYNAGPGNFAIVQTPVK